MASSATQFYMPFVSAHALTRGRAMPLGSIVPRMAATFGAACFASLAALGLIAHRLIVPISRGDPPG